MPHGIRKKSIRDPKSDVERQSSRIPELEQLSVKMDYEQSGSNLDSGSLIAIHHNSTLLQDETEKLSDVAYEVKRKENE